MSSLSPTERVQARAVALTLLRLKVGLVERRDADPASLMNELVLPALHQLAPIVPHAYAGPPPSQLDSRPDRLGATFLLACGRLVRALAEAEAAPWSCLRQHDDLLVPFFADLDAELGACCAAAPR